MNILLGGLFTLSSYLLGSVPVALLLARVKGVDIRKVGSGNVGATNVFRSVSKGLGIATFALDALKGFVPAALFPPLAQRCGAEPGALLGILCGCAAIAGHNWPVYIGFKGGKGVATSAGVLLGIAPLAVGIGLLSWIVLFVATRYVSVASIGAAVIVGALAWPLYLRDGLLLPIALTVLAALAVARHRSNIERLVKRTEHRFEFRSRGAHEAHEMTRKEEE